MPVLLNRDAAALADAVVDQAWAQVTGQGGSRIVETGESTVAVLVSEQHGEPLIRPPRRGRVRNCGQRPGGPGLELGRPALTSLRVTREGAVWTVMHGEEDHGLGCGGKLRLDPGKGLGQQGSRVAPAQRIAAEAAVDQKEASPGPAVLDDDAAIERTARLPGPSPLGQNAAVAFS